MSEVLSALLGRLLDFVTPNDFLRLFEGGFVVLPATAIEGLLAPVVVPSVVFVKGRPGRPILGGILNATLVSE
jgi:hypothetical protein